MTNELFQSKEEALAIEDAGCDMEGHWQGVIRDVAWQRRPNKH